jgi:hypothetical protein
MSDFESDLRAALGRKQPSRNFVARVLSKAEAGHARAWPRSLALWIPAAAAVIALIATSVAAWERQRRAEHARDQLLEALKITAEKLAFVQDIAKRNLEQNR